MNKTMISKDPANKKMVVTRSFSAPVEQVWRAWTESSILDQWWAPKPWKATTKTMDFSEGGHWLYCMEGPDGTVHWGRFNYKTIDTGKKFTGEDLFCDENGVPNNAFPGMQWSNSFSSTDTGTEVTIHILFNSEEDMQRIVEMGFQEGFTAAHDNLEELLAGRS